MLRIFISKDENRKDNKYSLFIHFACIGLLVLAPKISWSEENLEEEPAGDPPVWVYQLSAIKECQDSKRNLKIEKGEMKSAEKKLTKIGIRVLASERNVVDTTTTVSKCGDPGKFISCFLIFPAEKSKALAAGFIEGGNCGKAFEKRSH